MKNNDYQCKNKCQRNTTVSLVPWDKSSYFQVKSVYGKVYSQLITGMSTDDSYCCSSQVWKNSSGWLYLPVMSKNVKTQWIQFTSCQFRWTVSQKVWKCQIVEQCHLLIWVWKQLTKMLKSVQKVSADVLTEMFRNVTNVSQKLSSCQILWIWLFQQQWAPHWAPMSCSHPLGWRSCKTWLLLPI